MQQVQLTQTVGTILCCMCGTPITPNAANMCVECLRSRVDITEQLPKQLTVSWCKGCGRYLNPPKQWVSCELESRELLVLCLKRMKGLNKVKLVDAAFVWTEPHSKRLKVKLTVQAEVVNGAILQQTFIAEYIVANHMCLDCHRQAAQDHWTAQVQVRQRVDHKRTFLYLEQVLLRHGVHKDASSIKERPDGLDFYFHMRNHARRFVDFLGSVLCVRFKTSEQLISADTHTGKAKVKYSFSVDIPPVCKDDIVLLPRKLSQSFGGGSPLLVVTKVSNLLHLLDPVTLHTIDLNATHYWRTPMQSLLTYNNLVEFVVIDIEPVAGQPQTGRYLLADATVARVSDFGSNDKQFTTRTHLGRLLQAGDLVYGYDIGNSNLNDADVWVGVERLPELVLVRKSYSDRRRRRRGWEVRRMATTTEEGIELKRRMDDDMEGFMREIEEDPDLRANVLLYKDQTQFDAAAAEDTQVQQNPDEYAPAVELAAILDQMQINDDDDDDDEEEDGGDDEDEDGDDDDDEGDDDDEDEDDNAAAAAAAGAAATTPQAAMALLEQRHQQMQAQVLQEQRTHKEQLMAAHNQHVAQLSLAVQSGQMRPEQAQAALEASKVQLAQYEQQLAARHASEQQQVLQQQAAEKAQFVAHIQQQQQQQQQQHQQQQVAQAQQAASVAAAAAPASAAPSSSSRKARRAAKR